MAAQLPQSGELFEQQYRVMERIGSGGFANVYRAQDTNTRRSVAIKVLVPGEDESSHSERMVARFEREARLLAGLKSQHTVTMFEFGRSETGLLYLVFEFVDGTTLGRLSQTLGALPPARVVAILEQVCEALAEAHRLGVLHRDIKPANIMVYEHLGVRDLVKLLDFGIAKPIMDRSDGGEFDESTITSEGALIGTPRYMSPEQIAQQELTAASDIYSLGLVAYELLTGAPAIEGSSTTEIIRRQLSPTEIAFPDSRATSPGLRRVVQKMTRKSRADRYQNVEEVLGDLRAWEESDDRRLSIRWPIVGVAAGIALLVAAFWWRSGDEPRPRTEPMAAAPRATLGTPVYEVSMETPGLTWIWLKSGEDFKLRGSRDPTEIPPLHRTVVAVELDGAPVEAGKRLVTDLSGWDGESTQTLMYVREVPEETFQYMADAQMKGVRLGQHCGRNVTADLLAQIIEEEDRSPPDVGVQ